MSIQQDAIETAVNLVQAVNRQVSGIERAPDLENYPGSIYEMELPICLTDVGRGFFQGQGEDVIGEFQFTITCLYERVAVQDPGLAKQEGLRAFGAFIAKYTDEDTYLVTGKRILMKEPYSIEIVGNAQWDTSGYVVMQYPQNSQIPFWGFDVRCQVRIEFDRSCIRDSL